SAFARFDELLIRAGYLDVHASLYVSRRFRMTNSRWFRVREEFPRIRPSDVRRGIVSADYQVSIDSCAPFGLEGQDAIQLLLGTNA
ncbi:MAG: PD-(D/E)XK motif protein, partial [Magnetococcales bacterium]|nr:PD-(D/E)XK motif protein [Magnetococcales bacterium]